MDVGDYMYSKWFFELLDDIDIPHVMANIPLSPSMCDMASKQLDLTVDTSCDSAASTLPCRSAMKEEDSEVGAGGTKRSGDDSTSDTSQGHSPAKRQVIQHTHSVFGTPEHLVHTAPLQLQQPDALHTQQQLIWTQNFQGPATPQFQSHMVTSTPVQWHVPWYMPQALAPSLLQQQPQSSHMQGFVPLSTSLYGNLVFYKSPLTGSYVPPTPVIRTDSAPSASESRPAAAPTPVPPTPQPEAAPLQSTPTPAPVTAPATPQPEAAPLQSATLQPAPAPTPAPPTPQPEAATLQPAAAAQPSPVASPPQSAAVAAVQPSPVASPNKHVPLLATVPVQRLPLPETTQCSREVCTITAPAPAPQHTTKGQKRKQILTEKDGASDSCDNDTESDTDDYRRSRGRRDNRDRSTPDSMEKLAASALINMRQQPSYEPEPQLQRQQETYVPSPTGHVLLDEPSLLPILQALDMKYLINNESEITESFSARLQYDYMSVEVMKSCMNPGVRVFFLTFPNINRAKHLINFVDGICDMKKQRWTQFKPTQPIIVGISFSQTDAAFIAMVSVMMSGDLVRLDEIEMAGLSPDRRCQLWSSVMQCVEMVALCKKRPVYLNRHSVYVDPSSLHCTNMMFFTCVNWKQLTTPTQGLSAIARFVLGPIFGDERVERAIPADDKRPRVQMTNVMWRYTVEACWDYNLIVTRYPETWTGRPISRLRLYHTTPNIYRNILIGQLGEWPLTACLVPELWDDNGDDVTKDMCELAKVLCDAVGEPPDSHTSVLQFDGQEDALTADMVAPSQPQDTEGEHETIEIDSDDDIHAGPSRVCPPPIVPANRAKKPKQKLAPVERPPDKDEYIFRIPVAPARFVRKTVSRQPLSHTNIGAKYAQHTKVYNPQLKQTLADVAYHADAPDMSVVIEELTAHSKFLPTNANYKMEENLHQKGKRDVFARNMYTPRRLTNPIMPKRDSVAIVPTMPPLRDPRTGPLSAVTKWHLPHWMDFTPTGDSPGYVVYEPTSRIDAGMVYKPKIEFPSNRHGTMLSSVFQNSQVWGKSCKLVMPSETPRSVTNKIIKILSLPMYMRDCQYVPRMFTLLANEPNELKTQQTTTLIAFHDPPGARALSNIKFKSSETMSATALKSLHVMGAVKCVARTHLMFYRKFGFFWSFTSVSSIMLNETTHRYSLDLFNVLSENLFVNEAQVKPDKLQFGTTFNPVAFATALVSFLNIVDRDDRPAYHRALAKYAETGTSSYLFPDDGTPPESTSMVLYYIATRCKLLNADYNDPALWTERVPELSCYMTNPHHKEFMFKSNVESQHLVFSLPLHVSVAHYTVKWTRGTVDVPVEDKAPTYTLSEPKLLSELLSLDYLRAQGSAKSRAAPAGARAVGGSASGRTALKQSGATDKGSSSKGKGKGLAGPTKKKSKSAKLVYYSDSEEFYQPSPCSSDPENSGTPDISTFSEIEYERPNRPSRPHHGRTDTSNESCSDDDNRSGSESGCESEAETEDKRSRQKTLETLRDTIEDNERGKRHAEATAAAKKKTEGPGSSGTRCCGCCVRNFHTYRQPEPEPEEQQQQQQKKDRRLFGSKEPKSRLAVPRLAPPDSDCAHDLPEVARQLPLFNQHRLSQMTNIGRTEEEPQQQHKRRAEARSSSSSSDQTGAGRAKKSAEKKTRKSAE